mmetsp:Transcript_15642/g.47670  ORF Transcript_15642/g.47670 Transcript_15642/m.47670 type:complete len:453 (+) Transcript_15642:260-1618(+)
MPPAVVAAVLAERREVATVCAAMVHDDAHELVCGRGSRQRNARVEVDLTEREARLQAQRAVVLVEPARGRVVLAAVDVQAERVWRAHEQQLLVLGATAHAEAIVGADEILDGGRILSRKGPVDLLLGIAHLGKLLHEAALLEHALLVAKVAQHFARRAAEALHVVEALVVQPITDALLHRGSRRGHATWDLERNGREAREPHGPTAIALRAAQGVTHEADERVLEGFFPVGTPGRQRARARCVGPRGRQRHALVLGLEPARLLVNDLHEELPELLRVVLIAEVQVPRKRALHVLDELVRVRRARRLPQVHGALRRERRAGEAVQEPVQLAAERVRAGLGPRARLQLPGDALEERRERLHARERLHEGVEEAEVAQIRQAHLQPPPPPPRPEQVLALGRQQRRDGHARERHHEAAPLQGRRCGRHFWCREQTKSAGSPRTTRRVGSPRTRPRW